MSSRHYSPNLLWISIQRWNKLIIGEPLEFGSIANDRAGWLQIVQSLESVVRNLTALSLPFCVSFQLLRQIGRHVGEDDRVVTVVAQFQYVTDPVNLGDQRALVCGDAEPGAQSP